MGDYITEICAPNIEGQCAEMFIVGGAVRNKLYNSIYCKNVPIKDKDLLV
jgi:tRNA nucleotidyltransferase/poly(A) polymerase